MAYMIESNLEVGKKVAVTTKSGSKYTGVVTGISADGDKFTIRISHPTLLRKNEYLFTFDRRVVEEYSIID